MNHLFSCFNRRCLAMFYLLNFLSPPFPQGDGLKLNQIFYLLLFCRVGLCARRIRFPSCIYSPVKTKGYNVQAGLIRNKNLDSSWQINFCQQVQPLQKMTGTQSTGAEHKNKTISFLKRRIYPLLAERDDPKWKLPGSALTQNANALVFCLLMCRQVSGIQILQYKSYICLQL